MSRYFESASPDDVPTERESDDDEAVRAVGSGDLQARQVTVARPPTDSVVPSSYRPLPSLVLPVIVPVWEALLLTFFQFLLRFLL